jgi:hypothetical protein
LVFASLAVGLAYLFGGFIPKHAWLIAPAAVLCLAAAFWNGLHRSRAVTAFARLRSATAWVLAVAAVMVLPAGLRWISLRRELQTIPVPADASDVRAETNVVFWQRHPYVPPYSMTYVTALPFDAADRFLTTSLTKNGWKVGGRYRPVSCEATEVLSQNVAELFDRQPESGQLRNYIVIRGDRWMSVTLFGTGNECWVLCEAQGAEPPDALRRFWR